MCEVWEANNSDGRNLGRLCVLVTLFGGLMGCALGGQGLRERSEECMEPIYVVDQIEGQLALVIGPEGEEVLWNASPGLKEGVALKADASPHACGQQLFQEVRRLRARF